MCSVNETNDYEEKAHRPQQVASVHTPGTVCFQLHFQQDYVAVTEGIILDGLRLVSPQTAAFIRGLSPVRRNDLPLKLFICD